MGDIKELQTIIKGSKNYFMNQKEVWVKTKQSDLYEVSDLGNLRRIESIVRSNFGRTRKQKAVIKKQTKSTIGYKTVSLWIDGVEARKYMHVLIAEAFIPNPKNKPHVNHKNGIRADNRIENLEWCTPSENLMHSVYVLNKNPTNWVKKSKVLCIDNGIQYNSIAEAAKLLNLTADGICHVCRGKFNATGKLRFKYII